MPYAYDGPKWQELPNQELETITITERRCLSTNCPFCQHDFTNGQFVAKYRCGHAVCTDCYDNAIHRGWNRCTLCRRSGTTRRTRAIVIPNNNNNGDDNNGDVGEDLAVFLRPENVATEPVTSSDDVVPRHVVVEHYIEHHRAKMEEHSEAIMDLIAQLSIHRDEYNEHKRLLQERLDEQVRFSNPAVAAAATAAAAAAVGDNGDEEDVSSHNLDPIATYDNAAAAATSVTITVNHLNHPMQLFPDTYVCILPRGSDVKSFKSELLAQHFAAFGWTAREMTLMMTGASNNLLELDEEYTFITDMTLSLQLVQHIPTASTEDSEPANDNHDNDNNNTSTITIPMPVSRSDTGVAEDAALDKLPVCRSDTGGVSGAASSSEAPDLLSVSRSDTGNGEGGDHSTQFHYIAQLL